MAWLVLYFGLCSVFLRALRVPVVRFDFVVTATWLGSIALSFVPVVHYPHGVADRTILLIVLSHAALLGGFYALGGDRSNVRQYEGSIGSATRLLAPISLIFVAVSFGAALSVGRIPVIGTFRSLEATRAAYLEQGFANRIEAIATALHYVAIVFVMLLPLYLRERRRRLIVAACIVFVGIVETSFAAGARGSIVFTLVGVVASYLLCFPFTIKRYLAIFSVGVVAILVLGGTFLASRNQDLANAPDYYLARNCAGATFGEAVRGKPQLESLAIAGCYFSSPTYVFDMFITDDTINTGWVGRLGTYNLGRLFQDDFAEIRAEVAAFFRQRSHAENPWATTVRDMWLDLRGLAPVGFLILGGVVAALTRRAKNELDLARLALMAPVGFMLPFISPVIIPQLVYPIIVTLLMQMAISSRAADAASPDRTLSRRTRSARVCSTLR